MIVNQSIIKKETLKKIYPNSLISDDVSNIYKIHKSENNISIWERELDSEIIESSKKVLVNSPGLRFSEILGPKNVKKRLSEKFSSNDESNLLINDISSVVDLFCNLFSLKKVWLRLDAIEEPMCPRFHTDTVKCRLVTTYYGPGTQWLPHDSVNRSKLGDGNQGKPDKKSGLFKSKKDIRELKTGHIALLKGEDWEGNKGLGLVHRSPHRESSYKRLYMTIDFLEFYLSIYQRKFH